MANAIATCIRCRVTFREFSARHGSLLARILRHYAKYHDRPLPTVNQMYDGPSERKAESLLNPNGYLIASMSAARRNDDPLRSARQALVSPIGRLDDMEGGGISPFLSGQKPMLDNKGADDRKLRNARSDSDNSGKSASVGVRLPTPFNIRAPTGPLSGNVATVPEPGLINQMIEGQHGEAPSPLNCDRMDYAKRCATCGKKSHLRFDRGGNIWYRCRKDLTEGEALALERMLGHEREKVYRAHLKMRAEVGQDLA